MMRPLKTCLLLALVGLLASCGEPERGPAIAGPTVLVVAHAAERSGDIPDYQGLYATYEIELSRAHAFKRQDLSRLRWRQIRTDFPRGGRERVFEGPSLSLVLAEAGVRNQSVRLTSFDGYEVEIEAEMIARHDPILALRIDGESLAIGGYGPVMLVWPRRDRGALADMPDDLWPWGIFAITVLDDPQ